MTFDVTNLDKILLIKTLYAHAEPVGLGKVEYSNKAKKGENVIGLTDEECKDILRMDTPDIIPPLIDYLKGKPIKLDLDHQANGKIWVSALSYDLCNGRYRFLEALLNVFDLDEILFIKKDYPGPLDEIIDENTNRPIEETLLLKDVVKCTIQHTDKNGTYWTIDTDEVDYKPYFMRSI